MGKPSILKIYPEVDLRFSLSPAQSELLNPRIVSCWLDTKRISRVGRKHGQVHNSSTLHRFK